jgi:hypothetical protein
MSDVHARVALVTLSRADLGKLRIAPGDEASEMRRDVVRQSKSCVLVAGFRKMKPSQSRLCLPAGAHAC